MYVYACVYVYVYVCVYTHVYVYVYTYLCIDCEFQYQCFSVWTVLCMRMCIRVHVNAYAYVCKYIYMCIFFCSECYMHFGTGVLGPGAWAGVYVTQVYFYTNVHICKRTRCRLCTYVYMYICVLEIILDLPFWFSNTPHYVSLYVCICMHMYIDAYVRL